MSPKELLGVRKFWFGGPEYLKESEKSWPDLEIGDKFDRYRVNISEAVNDDPAGKIPCASNHLTDNDKTLDNGNVTNLVNTTHILTFNIAKVINIERFNDINKLYRVTAYVIKFKDNLMDAWRISKLNKRVMPKRNKKKVIECDITCDEILRSKILWVQSVQEVHRTSDESKFNQLKKQLNLFCDENGLWRCGGRLVNADMNYDTKHPYLIPKDTHFARLLVINSHWEVMHNDVKETLNNLRSAFWIPRCRNFIRKIIHKCWLCQYFEGRSYDYPEAPPLPDFRVKNDFAFTYTGVDYAGPLYVRNIYTKPGDKSMFKCWIALFTCANSRCIFLDLVYDSGAQACVSALRRFISSRGAPKLIDSDNGSAFTSNVVQKFATSRYIRWKLNTEEAPWMGGFFERMVKSVKRCLKKVLGTARLNYDELITVLKEIENVINNRPLIYMYDNVNQEVVTPNKLLFGRNLETVAPNEETENETDLSKRAKYQNTVLDHWWKRWRKNYLLEHRNSINTNRRNGLSFPKYRILYSLLSGELVGSQNLFQVKMVKFGLLVYYRKRLGICYDQ